jgi:NAD(P)-dependent dehydrogenase (short-subunit alcohol dehydrogenase family)
MQRRGGAIINISSVRAFVSYPGGAAYDSSKAALIAFTRALALDHGKDGIRVNAICPGYIDTPMTDEWLKTVPDRHETMRQLLAVHPLGRIGTPRDIAEAALFLASGAACFITGTALVVDGGMSTAGH